MEKNAILDIIANDLKEMELLLSTFRSHDTISSAFIDLLRAKHQNLGTELTLLNYWADGKPMPAPAPVAPAPAEPVAPVATVAPKAPEATPAEKAKALFEKMEEAKKKREESFKKINEETPEAAAAAPVAEEVKPVPEPAPAAEPVGIAPMDVVDDTDDRFSYEIESPAEPAPAPQPSAPAQPAVSASRAADIANYGTPVEDIRKALSLNDNFLFQRELFGGSSDRYQHALDTVNASATFDEARAALLAANQWNDDDKVVEGFFRAVHRRFL